MTVAVGIVDRLASLLEYPGPTCAGELQDCLAHRDLLPADAADALQEYAAAIQPLTLRQLQEMYSQTFDFNPACTLDVGWHLFGDRFERGAFLSDVRTRLAAAGIEERGELPDFLPHLLRLLSRAPADQAIEIRAIVARGVAQLTAALRDRESPYHHLITSAFAAASRGA